MNYILGGVLSLLVVVPPLAFAADDFIDTSVTSVEVQTFASEEALAESLGKSSFSELNFYRGVYAPDVESTLTVPGAVSCFDHYTFGSVPVALSSSVESVVPGVPVTFSALVQNTNEYPIIDGSVVIKIFREQSDSTARLTQGNHTVDQFVAASDINLGARSELTYTFSWSPPENIPAGRYYAATYFVTAGRFNLSGLSFTDDIVGSTYTFNVVSDADGVYFDKRSVRVNGAPYFFIGQPRAVPDTPTDIAAVVRNDSREEKTVNITWFLFRWDALRAENLVDTVRQSVVVPQEGSATVRFLAKDTDYSVYLAVPVLYDERGVPLGSFLNIRFLREDVDVPRLNFPSTLTYPLVAGEEASFFACIHNAGLGDTVNDVALNLQLVDKQNRVLEDYTYEGTITGAMLGFVDSFIPKKNYDNFTLIATLSARDTVLDRVAVSYTCATFNPLVNCAEESTFSGGAYVAAVGGLVGLLLLFFVLVVLKKKR